MIKIDSRSRFGHTPAGDGRGTAGVTESDGRHPTREGCRLRMETAGKAAVWGHRQARIVNLLFPIIFRFRLVGRKIHKPR